MNNSKTNNHRDNDTPLVISASRRTDLVSCYPAYLIEKLREYTPARVHTVVLWTKNPANMLKDRLLRDCLAQYRQLYIHLTITGLGGTMLEPGIPRWETVAEMIPGMLELVKRPERISWRFDPLICAEVQGSRISNFDLFPVLAGRIKQYGITVCRTSWVEPYKKVIRRMEKKGITLITYELPDRREQAQTLEQTAAAMGMNIQYCSIESFPRSHCIDGRLLSGLHPEGLSCSFKKANGQRTLCGCTESIDIGWYSLKCPSGCLYCYAEPLIA